MGDSLHSEEQGHQRVEPTQLLRSLSGPASHSKLSDTWPAFYSREYGIPVGLLVLVLEMS